MNGTGLKFFEGVFFIVAEESLGFGLNSLGFLGLNVLADLRVFSLLVQGGFKKEICNYWFIATNDFANVECNVLVILLLQICKWGFKGDLKALKNELLMTERIADKGLDIVLDVSDYVFGREKSTSCQIVIFQHFAQRLIA